MIYLDIDGVLILKGDRSDSPAVIKRAQIVAQMCQRTNSEIVLCSQRRISNDVMDILTSLGLKRFMAKDCAAKTPFIDHDDLDPDLPVRGQEIDAHMTAHGIVRHVILDDDFTLDHHHHIQVDPDIGLVDQHVDDAINLLR